jgi:hypothetical protein
MVVFERAKLGILSELSLNKTEGNKPKIATSNHKAG